MYANKTHNEPLDVKWNIAYQRVMWTWQHFSSSSAYWEEIFNMTFDWSNGKVKVQHYVKTNPMTNV
jgi:outer membrane phospholipase A